MVLLRRMGLATVAMLLMGTAGARADFIIDNFSTVTSTTIVSGSPAAPKFATNTDVDGSGVVGGYRDLYLARTTSNKGIVVGDAGDSVSGLFNLTTSGATGGYANLVYDGSSTSTVPKGPVPLAGINYTGLGNLDLTQSGANDAFVVKAASTAGARIDVTVYTDKNNYATQTLFIPGTMATSPLVKYNILFDPLAPILPGYNESHFAITGGSFSFTNVGAITVTVTGWDLVNNVPRNDADSTVLGTIVTAKAVPEPGSFALLGMGLAGLAVYRRRKAAK